MPRPLAALAATEGSAHAQWTVTFLSSASTFRDGNAHVYSVHGGQQAGSAAAGPSGPARARLWTGSLASRVDLHPAGATAWINDVSSGGC